MTEFTLHDKDTAPAASKDLLDVSIKAFGMVPNLHASWLKRLACSKATNSYINCF